MKPYRIKNSNYPIIYASKIVNFNLIKCFFLQFFLFAFDLLLICFYIKLCHTAVKGLFYFSEPGSESVKVWS